MPTVDSAIPRASEICGLASPRRVLVSTSSSRALSGRAASEARVAPTSPAPTSLARQNCRTTSRARNATTSSARHASAAGTEGHRSGAQTRTMAPKSAKSGRSGTPSPTARQIKPRSATTESAPKTKGGTVRDHASAIRQPTSAAVAAPPATTIARRKRSEETWSAAPRSRPTRMSAEARKTARGSEGKRTRRTAAQAHAASHQQRRMPARASMEPLG